MNPPEMDSGVVLELKNVSATPNVLEFLFARDGVLDQLLLRHSHGDWGRISNDERFANDLAIYQQQGTIVSRYEVDSTVIEIRTVYLKSLTTVGLPEDFQP